MMSIMVMMITALFDIPVAPHFLKTQAVVRKYMIFFLSVCISVS